MRLFNRRKSLGEFDDPQLVGMAPLCTLDNDNNFSLPTLHEESPDREPLGRGRSSISPGRHLDWVATSTTSSESDSCGNGKSGGGRERDSSPMPQPRLQQLNKSSNGNGISTWSKKVATRTWETLRRAESVERLTYKSGGSLISSSSNRRKTLHFFPELPEGSVINQKTKGNAPAIPKTSSSFRSISNFSTSTKTDSAPANSSSNSNPTLRRKLSRVESLRNLLSKSNRVRTNLKGRSKIDKGVDTTDLEGEECKHPGEIEDMSLDLADEVFESKGPSVNKRLTKATSCDNINVATMCSSDRLGSTSPGPSQYSTSISPGNSSKRSSFPYAYIRSKLSSLPEEPSIAITANKSPEKSFGFYHSMGNLLSSASSEASGDLEEDESLAMTKLEIESQFTLPRKCDPLAQIRIDLLHKNPADLDDAPTSPNLRLRLERRCFSIGNILFSAEDEKETDADICRRENNHREFTESGYDSDSTRNGHESPRNSVKLPADEEASAMSIPENKEDEPTVIEPCPNSPLPPKEFKFIKIDKEQLELEDEKENSSQSERCGEEVPNVETGSESQPHRTSFEEMNESDRVGRVNETENEGEENSDQFILNKSLDFSRILLIAPSSIPPPSLRLRNKVRDRGERDWSHLSRTARSKSLCLSIFTVTFEKGPRKKSLGFSVVGGKDSPRGSMGIFVRRIFPYGQAAEEVHGLSEGDEILSINGQPLADVTHAEALNIFKSIKAGDITLQVARREVLRSAAKNSTSRLMLDSHLISKSISCDHLDRTF